MAGINKYFYCWLNCHTLVYCHVQERKAGNPHWREVQTGALVARKVLTILAIIRKKHAPNFYFERVSIC